MLGRVYPPRTGGACLGARPARKKVFGPCHQLDELVRRLPTSVRPERQTWLAELLQNTEVQSTALLAASMNGAQRSVWCVPAVCDGAGGVGFGRICRALERVERARLSACGRRISERIEAKTICRCSSLGQDQLHNMAEKRRPP